MSRLTHFDQRRRRVRTALRLKSGGRPRLSVHRSSQHIYAQIIDDTNGVTLASASTLEKDVRGTTGATTGAATDAAATGAATDAAATGAATDAAATTGAATDAAATGTGESH